MLLYDHKEIESKWQKFWAENQTFKASNHSDKPKFYALDMFPYPSGAGLHVGHPLGYIASDIVSRFKRHTGHNVLHPMGYDSFGLPAEQYAIQTGQHPAITTRDNIARYREQMDRIGFSFDWSREVKTSEPDYYKFTQEIFIMLFESWYDKDEDRARPVEDLVSRFRESGTNNINAATEEDLKQFTAAEWSAMTHQQQQEILLNYRLTYLADTEVNWCPALGTVLANDEIVNGVSERGGHPVVRKKMRQWMMRISAFAERLLNDLEDLDWSDSIKEIQRNWIGKSVGAMVKFRIQSLPPTPSSGRGDSNETIPVSTGLHPVRNAQNSEGATDYLIPVFTTRPDTIYGVTFMTLAPEHELVDQITTPEQRKAVEEYKRATAARSERDRMADVKTISGVFTGAYAIHPLSGEPIPVWIGDYVLAGYGTGAVMAVPCGDERDHAFANYFAGQEGMPPIKNIFAGVDISEEAHTAKDDTPLTNSDFLDGLSYQLAMKAAIEKLEHVGAGIGNTNYRLRDAVFSRQRYWGEPFPVYYKDGLPQMIDRKHLPIWLPSVEDFTPTEDGKPPLGNALFWYWDLKNTQITISPIDEDEYFDFEYNTGDKTQASRIFVKDYDEVNFGEELDIFLENQDEEYKTPIEKQLETKYSNKNDIRKITDYSACYPMELNTMPGWAGSSWYMFRYMDAGNENEMFSQEAQQYWENVDLYIGGSEHATGHLLYSRFWVKFLHDRGKVSVKEPFKKMINQGMILGESHFLPALLIELEIEIEHNSIRETEFTTKLFNKKSSTIYLSRSAFIYYKDSPEQLLETYCSKVVEEFSNNLSSAIGEVSNIDFDLTNYVFVEQKRIASESYDVDEKLFSETKLKEIAAFAEDFIFQKIKLEDSGFEVEKMSKSKFNVVNPDDICNQYGADTLRLYEMFLGPLEQAKPWNTAGITGVYGFMKKLWKLYHDNNGFAVSDEKASPENMKTLHKTIKKVREDIENFSFNTTVSSFMIAVNEFTAQKCNSREVLEPLAVLVSPYAPHIAEELWSLLGHEESIAYASFPEFDEKFLVESSKTYPISFNGKMRFTLDLPADASKDELEKMVLENEKVQEQLTGKTIRKTIVVPGKVVNFVVG